MDVIPKDYWKGVKIDNQVATIQHIKTHQQHSILYWIKNMLINII